MQQIFRTHFRLFRENSTGARHPQTIPMGLPAGATSRRSRRQPLLILLVGVIAYVTAAKPASAGMPSAELIFTELGRRRWEELSFFLMGFLAMAGVVRWLWNALRRDFPQWPQISYRRSVALLMLWGLFVTVVLSLISGARELMTPGAWKPNGVTYQLAHQPAPAVAATAPTGVTAESDAERRLRLDNLRFALWQFALAHDGRFPTEKSPIAAELWQASSSPLPQFVYVPGVSVGQADVVIVYEPQIFGDEQYVLLGNGAIKKRSGIATVPPASQKSAKAGTATNERSTAQEGSN